MNYNNNINSDKYVCELQYLRALAVILVILYHLEIDCFSFGYLGVDIFFGLSGYLVGSNTYRILSKENFWLALYKILYKRFARIYPALAVVVLLTMALMAVIIPGYWGYSQFEKSGISALLFLSNIYYIISNNDYYAANASFNPFLHTWSLSVEFQFYIVLPFLVYIALKRRFDLLLTVALTIVSLLYFIWRKNFDESSAFYSTLARIWELLWGFCIFLYQDRFRNINPNHHSTPKQTAYLIAAIFVPSLIVGASNKILDFVLIFITGTLFLWAIEKKFINKLVHRILLILGDCSYSIYLAHWPIICLITWTVGLNFTARIIGLIASIASGVVLYYLVENRLRRDGGKIKIYAILFFAFGVTGAWYKFGDEIRVAMSMSTTVRESANWIEQARSPYSKANNLRPANEVRKVVVLGDSHAENLFASLSNRLNIMGHDFNLTANITRGCSPMNFWANISMECHQKILSELRHMKADLKEKDVLIIMSLKTPRLSEPWEKKPKVFEGNYWDYKKNYDLSPDFNHLMSKYADEIVSISRAGVFVYLVDPTPVFRYANFRCADFYTQRNPICAQSSSEPIWAMSNLWEPYEEFYKTYLSYSHNIRRIEVADLFCDDYYCHSKKNGMPIFVDGDHLSPKGNALIATRISENLWMKK